MPIFIPDGRNYDPSLYQMVEIETHSYTSPQKLRPIRAALPYQAFLGSEPPGGLILKNQKGLKIHQTSKHQRKQNIPTSPGFWPGHSDTRCETCKSGLFCTSISSTNNGYKHIIKQPMTCKTKNVCYLINCKKCHQQYTGETQLKFHKRMNNYTSDIRQKKKSTGMVRHFAKCDLNNVQPIILERVRSSDPFIRKAREQFYINIFGTEINAQ